MQNQNARQKPLKRSLLTHEAAAEQKSLDRDSVSIAGQCQLFCWRSWCWRAVQNACGHVVPLVPALSSHGGNHGWAPDEDARPGTNRLLYAQQAAAAARMHALAPSPVLPQAGQGARCDRSGCVLRVRSPGGWRHCDWGPLRIAGLAAACSLRAPAASIASRASQTAPAPDILKNMRCLVLHRLDALATAAAAPPAQQAECRVPPCYNVGM
eukprot:SAG31_NODE_4401_length_3267_cov_3.672033_2_plen_211_part_00